MNERTFYIPVEMEVVPLIEKKIDFCVDEKFDFAHPEIPPEIAPTLTIKKNDVTIANFRPSDKFDTTANITVPTKTSDLLNDSAFIVGSDVPSNEEDPTVPVWAKAQSKPTYTASEVHALPDTTVIPSATSQLVNDSGFITSVSLPTKTSDLTNDSGFITGTEVPSHEADPTVPAWAKASTKPTYTAMEVHALPDTTVIPSTTSQLTNDSGFITSASLPTKVSDLTNDIGFIVGADVPSNETDPTVPSWAKQPNKPTYTASEVHALSDSTVIPSATSQLTNDSGFISTELDPTVPAWAKASTKPTYTASEVHALPDTTVIPTVPTNVSAFTNDSGYITANGIPVKSVDGKTGEVVVEKVTKLQKDLDCTYQIIAESVGSNGFSGTNSFTVGGTKTLFYIDDGIYRDSAGTQPEIFPDTVMSYAIDFMGWDVQIISFSDIMISQEIKLYKLCKLTLSEISQNIYMSTIDSIEFKSSDGSTLIWHNDGEIETL